MKKRRVGTLSMGIVLIAFGILIFIAQVNSISAINLSIKFWPIILFLIGGEILWYSYKYRDEDINIKYDVFSVFIVLLIVVINLGIYGIVETGVASKVISTISSESFTFKIPYREIEIGNNIEKIIVEVPRHCKLNMRSEKDNKIIFSGSADIAAENKEKAKEFLNDEYIITKSSGNTLYVSFPDTSIHNNRAGNFSPYKFNLSIPEDKKVEINGEGDSLDLTLDSMKNDWVIDNISNVKIRLGKNMDTKLEALVYGVEALGGNVKWETANAENSEEVDKIKGKLVYGEGNNSIYILTSGEVEVNTLRE
ncbi:hypothetical protein L0P54_06950 [Anaerosalibacter bizertensis]|uniref:hypothetical protein n=1 Tax=Anaerosalibacter bizertensis TaxID=932217 RepID=UPI001D0154F0|nr:hypothetical protein [Anaerosalibacter bizertensis]MBV1819530.1 hypothetical protein [Bacteroidales bacterium MSK.15.36]MCB5558356.1 hypothetical protein [Anaerosalibacter bizertensis]MCG4582720.1 hypothetical protein [Anaerosalibacter bizertensis]